MKLDCGPTWQEKWEARQKWHRWFAWRPVRVGSHDCRWHFNDDLQRWSCAKCHELVEGDKDARHPIVCSHP